MVSREKWIQNGRIVVKKTFLVPSLLAAGFVHVTTTHSAPPSSEADTEKKSSLFDIFQFQHAYILAGHRSHSSHASHGSHRSSSGGGYVAPRPSRAVSPPPKAKPLYTTPSRNTNSTPPSSILPSSPSLAPKTLPGNSHKFHEIARQVQTALLAYGYYTGVVDGIVGSQTRTALSKMQADYGLKITGTITPEVLNALRIVAQ